MPTSRTITICIVLFLASALLSITFQKLNLPSRAVLPSPPAFWDNVPTALQTDHSPPKKGEDAATRSTTRKSSHDPKKSSGPGPKYAFALFLAGSESDELLASQAAALDRDENEDTPVSVPEVEVSDSGNTTDTEWETELKSIRDEENEGYGYYLGARVLVYTLLHHPSTKSGGKSSYSFYAQNANVSQEQDSKVKAEQQQKLESGPVPVLVLHTPSVPAYQLRRLEKDGATLVPTEPLAANWITKGLGSSRWNAVLAKLRLWEQEGWDKLCFIDNDMLVTAPLDGVFEDPSIQIQQTRRLMAADGTDSLNLADEGEMPGDYLFAGRPEGFEYAHGVPPEQVPQLPSRPRAVWEPQIVDNDNPFQPYLNAGFFVIRPSRLLFDYYYSLLQIPDKFNPGFPEQNLLNYAHRRDGPMPWSALGWRWNMNWPTMRDYEGGARSFHAKYWDHDGGHDPRLKRIWEDQVKEMKGFYRGREAEARRQKSLHAQTNQTDIM